MVKSRYPESHEEVLKHYLTKYKSQVAEGIQLWSKGQYEDEESAKEFMDSLSIAVDDEMKKLDQIKIDVSDDSQE